MLTSANDPKRLSRQLEENPAIRAGAVADPKRRSALAACA